MPNAKPLSVLVVDDEPLARERLLDLLRREPGIEIAGTADNGIAAIEAIRARRPDLVFLDVQMPGKTGLDVVREIGFKLPVSRSRREDLERRLGVLP